MYGAQSRIASYYDLRDKAPTHCGVLCIVILLPALPLATVEVTVTTTDTPGRKGFTFSPGLY